MNLLWVCLGGAAGSGARYLIGLAALRWLGLGFPWGTLAVNVLGSFLLALLLEEAMVARSTPEVRLALGAGVMGGLTTYSTFNIEALRMLERGAPLLGLGYVALTLSLCLCAGLSGRLLGRALG